MIERYEVLLTKDELAKKLKVSVRSVDVYVQEGMPQFSRKPIRFLESECREWIKKRR
jgi:predicted DNA-binding transcriptional regulator AlpA